MKKLYILKAGGELLDDPVLREQLLKSVSGCGHSMLLVHGGGKVASEIGRRLGLEPQYAAGRRITDAATLELVTMVYGGLLNKQLVADLSAVGKAALGVCGADGNLLRATRRPAGVYDFGFAGDVDKVDVDVYLLENWLEAGLLPVIAPLTHDGQGQLLNTNADTIAAVIAMAMQQLYAVELIYLFNFPGVLLQLDQPESLVPEINRNLYNQLRSEGVVSGGMLPKLENALSVAEAGVSSVVLTDVASLPGQLGGKATGTRILKG